MLGAHEVTAYTPRVQYKFTISRKFTIIRGQSATGKTTLYKILLDKEAGDASSCFISDVPCISANYLGGYWEMALQMTHNSIILIDEDTAWVHSERFASAAQKSDNYFIIINRHPLAMLPYSVREIYEIKSSGKYHRLVPVYTGTTEMFKPDCILTEDKNSGCDFFKAVCYNCEPAEGKSRVFNELESGKYDGHKCLVVVDGAAFGNEVERVVQTMSYLKGDVRLFMPESFEWLLLHSPMFSGLKRVQEVLRDPASHIDTDYNSWEQFFTAYISEITAGTPAAYTKDHLRKCYTEACCWCDKPCVYKALEDKPSAILAQISNVDLSNVRK